MSLRALGKFDTSTEFSCGMGSSGEGHSVTRVHRRRCASRVSAIWEDRWRSDIERSSVGQIDAPETGLGATHPLLHDLQRFPNAVSYAHVGIVPLGDQPLDLLIVGTIAQRPHGSVAYCALGILERLD